MLFHLREMLSAWPILFCLKCPNLNGSCSERLSRKTLIESVLYLNLYTCFNFSNSRIIFHLFMLVFLLLTLYKCRKNMPVYIPQNIESIHNIFFFPLYIFSGLPPSTFHSRPNVLFPRKASLKYSRKNDKFTQ